MNDNLPTDLEIDIYLQEMLRGFASIISSPSSNEGNKE